MNKWKIMKKEIKIFYTKDWPSSSAGKADYELLDTGEGEKLERFGPYTFIRPYKDAVWPKCQTPSVGQMWMKADGKFWSSKSGGKGGLATLKQRGNGWKMSKTVFDTKWEMGYKGIKFFAFPTPFRHLGFFPEQASHWDFIEEKISKATQKTVFGETSPKTVFKPKFLNLFGYTGVASLFALRAGAEVTHLDASKQSLDFTKDNQKLNAELAEAPMRVIEDDALKFLEREEKRGNKYDAIIMDPPKFGRGPKGEVWKIEEMLSKLLSSVRKILSDRPLFVILTSYAIDSSSLSIRYALEDMMKDFSGTIEAGELCILEKSNNRFIPLANTAVWSV